MKIPKEVVLKFAGLFPECSTTIENKEGKYPFSYSHLISSLLKQAKKKDSGTLSGKSMEEILAVSIHFLQLFTGFSFKKDFLRLFGIDERIEYYSEPEEDVITKELEENIESILAYTTKGILSNNIDSVCNKTELLKDTCERIREIKHWWEGKGNEDISAQIISEQISEIVNRK